jgi:MFS family permease
MTSEAATTPAEVRFDRQKKALAWFIATCVFANHYCRDTPGALERQLEYNLGGPLSDEQYNHLQTAFFLPDIFSPLLASMLIKTVGGADNMLVYTTVMGSAGVLLFAICVTNGSVGGMFAGRFLSGAMYEVIDMIPIVILGPLFGDGWGAMVGGVNAFLRLGSALNFIVSPLVYREAGLPAAVYTSFAFSLIMVVFGLLARRTYASILSDRRLLKQQQQHGMDMDQVDGNEEEEEEEEEEEDTCTGCSFPLSKFSRVYYLYAGSGFFLYGAMVPFWFVGSKFLQLKYVP